MPVCPFCSEQIDAGVKRCPHCEVRLDGTAPTTTRRVLARPAPVPAKKSGMSRWVIALISCGILSALFFPTFSILRFVKARRDAAREAACQNNLRQIAVALNNYRETYGAFPPAYIADESGKPMHSWRVLLLPFLDQKEIYDKYDFSRPWDSAHNKNSLEYCPDIYRCPSDDDADANTTSYAAVFGPDCVFQGAKATKSGEITDDHAKTLMVGEVAGRGISWTKPEDIDVTLHPDLGDENGFSTHHHGGCNFVTAACAVKFVPGDIDKPTFRALYTRAGNDAVQDF